MTDSMAEIVDLPSAERGARQPRARYGERALIVCDNLVKIYKVADLEVVALQGLDLLVESGEFIALVGASGSGKSTLLNVLGGLDVPSAGRATVAGYQLAELGPREQTRYLRQVIGFVWQQTGRNLLPYLTRHGERRAADGVRRRPGRHPRDQGPRAASPGRAGRATRPPAAAPLGRGAAAGGDRRGPGQRARGDPRGRAHRRAGLATAPPRSSSCCDGSTASSGVTIVVATHDPLVSSQVSRTVAIRDGRVSSEVLRHRSGPGRRRSPCRDRVRGPRSRRSIAVAARPRRGARARETRPPRSRGGPHPRVAGSDRRGTRGRAASPRRSRGRADERDRPRGRRRAPMVETRGLGRDFAVGPVVVHALRDVEPHGRPRTAGGRARAVGFRQDDPAVADRRARPGDLGRCRRRRAIGRRHEPRCAGRAAAPQDRVHLPGVRPAVDPVGRGERRGPAPARQGRSGRA